MYRLEPLDTSGVFLGLGAVQCSLLGGGITLAVVAISAGIPLLGAAVPVIATAMLSFARIGGRPGWEWLPLWAGWGWSQALWGRRWSAPLPLWPVDETKAHPLPPCLSSLGLCEIRWRDGPMLGCVRDSERHTLTAVVPVSAPSFVVEESGEQERLLSAWGDLLGQFASDRGAVAHLSWSDLIRPSQLHQHQDWLTSLERASPHPDAAGSYTDLVDLGCTTSMAHEVVVTVTVARDHLQRRHGSIGDGADDPLERSLGAAVDRLVRGLRAAGIGVGEPADARALQAMLRTRVDPLAAPRWRTDGRLANRLGLVTSASAGPLIVESAWRHVRVDSAWHRTYWVACWPRVAVPPCWLEPFIAADVARTMTVVLVPVPAHRSRRRIERDLVKLESDAATKEEKGRRVDARHQRVTEALLEREQELLAGFREVAYVGLVTVTATTEDDLDEHSQIAEQLAAEAGIELRVLDGRQDLGWAASLPFGVAPKTLLS